MESQKPLLKDENGEEVDVYMYRSMIGSLMYFTSSRPDIMFVVCACTRYQVNPKVSHLHDVKRIFRYLKGQPKLGLWYPKDSPVDLVAYTDNDYVGAILDRKSTTGGKAKKSVRLMMENVFGMELELMLVITVETQKPRKPKRKDTQVPQPSGPTDIVADDAIHKELGDSLLRAATTTSSLEVEHDSGNITKTRSKATPNEAGSQGTTSGGGPRRQETMGDTISQTRFANVSKISNDLLLVRGNTLRSGEDILKLKELMELCNNLQQRVLGLEKTKTTQQNEIASLKRRVKKLEQKKRSRTHGLKRLHKVGMSRRVESFRDEDNLGEDAFKQGRRINAINADEDITLVNVQNDVEMFDVNTLTAPTTLKCLKTKVKGVVIQEPSTTTTTIFLQQPSQDKGKGIMVEEPVKTMKKKDLLRLDEETAKRLQAEFDEDERLSRDRMKPMLP
ncbi:hypothetical protein Tco_0642215 [Tanacetum coccineum]